MSDWTSDRSSYYGGQYSARTATSTKAGAEPINHDCPCCNERFRSHHQLRNHQLKRRHHKCNICAQEFEDGDAVELHKYQTHPDDQILVCPGCGDVFNKAGGLLQHVEDRTGGCLVIRPAMLQKRRDEQNQFADTLRTLNKANDLSLVAGMDVLDLDDKPNRPQPDGARPHIKPDTTHQVYVRKPGAEAPPRPLDPPTYNNRAAQDEFPVLPGKGKSTVLAPLTAQNLAQAGEASQAMQATAWSQNKHLFPDAGPRVEPTPEQLAAMQAVRPAVIPKDAQGRVLDPIAPGFNVMRFHDRILGKFKCPHKNCNSKFPKGQNLTAHLKSPSHQPEVQITCPVCLNKFNTTAAAMQHAEASAVKCNIRQSEAFRIFVTQVSGGLIDGHYRRERGEDGGPSQFTAPRFFIPDSFIKSLDNAITEESISTVPASPAAGHGKRPGQAYPGNW